jgi:hypothetical protein
VPLYRPSHRFTPQSSSLHQPRLDNRARRTLLIDTRPAAAFLASHIKSSLKFSIPSLILKRSCKHGAAGFGSIDTLRQFITTDPCRNAWDALMAPGGSWDGDVIVYDEEMNPQDKMNAQVVAWALLPVISPLLVRGRADYLEGGRLAARAHLYCTILSFHTIIHPPPTCWIRCKKSNILLFLDSPVADLPPFPSQRTRGHLPTRYRHRCVFQDCSSDRTQRRFIPRPDARQSFARQ